MPAATNILNATTTSDATPAAQATPGAEIFAALLGGTEAVTAEGSTGEEAVTTEVTTEAQPNLDILAPLIAQQQVVPTVTVRNVAGGTAPAEGDTATTAIAGSAPISPLVPSEVEGRWHRVRAGAPRHARDERNLECFAPGTRSRNPGPGDHRSRHRARGA